MGIDIEANGADIDEDGRGTCAGDGASGGEKREGGKDDFIAWSDADGHERHDESIGAGTARDGVPDLKHGGAFLLEGEHIGAHDELTGGEHTIEGCAEFFRERVVLGVNVEEWNGHGREKRKF